MNKKLTLKVTNDSKSKTLLELKRGFPNQIAASIKRVKTIKPVKTYYNNIDKVNPTLNFLFMF